MNIQVSSAGGRRIEVSAHGDYTHERERESTKVDGSNATCITDDLFIGELPPSKLKVRATYTRLREMGAAAHMRAPSQRAARERLGQTHSEPNAPQRPSPACVISGPTVSRVQSSRTEAASCSAGGRAARRLRAADARWRQGWAESGGGGGGDEQGRALRWCSRRLDAQEDADVGLVLAVPDIVEKDRDCACGRRMARVAVMAAATAVVVRAALQPAEREGTRLGGAPA